MTTVQRRQRRAIAWGSGAFLGIGIGAALAYALGDPLLGVILAIAITVAVALLYLVAGHTTAEQRAERIVARAEMDDDDEDDDGTY